MTARPVIFGEVLFDRFPDGGAVLGGAPFNVAWHLQAFGLAPLLISRVGNDSLGTGILNTMREWGMDTTGIQNDPVHSTGTVEVSFSAGEPCFDIAAERAYDFIDAESLPALPASALIYHGSLAQRAERSHNALHVLKQRSGASCFVDINLRAPWWTPAIVEESLRDADWLKLNESELGQLLPEPATLEDRKQRLLNEYALRYLVVTEGSRGAEVITRNNERFQVDVPETVSVVDTVGAGDAFSSVLLLGVLRNWPLQETLRRAQIFAGAVVGVRGATVNDLGFYRPFVDDWDRDRP